MTTRFRKISRLAFSIGLLALVVYLADWREVLRVLRQADLLWIAGAFGLAGLDRLAINERWRILLRARGVEIRFLRLCRIQLGANFLGSFLPSSIGVDAIRIGALCRAGESAPAVIAATLVDRISLILASFLLGALMLTLFAHAFVPADVRWAVQLIAVLILAMTPICLHRSVRDWAALKILPRIPSRIRLTLHETLIAALKFRHERGAIISATLFTAMIFVIRIYFVQAIGFSLGEDIPILQLAVLVPILWVILMLPITVGAIGVQDAGYVALLSLIGVPAHVAVGMSLIEHVIARVGNLPGALFISDVMARRSSTQPTAA